MSKRMRRGGIVAAVAAAFLAVCVMVTSAQAATGITYAEKPENGTTQGQPFAPGTGGSQNFRIPGIVALDNGTIVASTDARWNHTGDGAGLDTIVSVSTDGGATWEYTFANYLGDNGNTYNNQSTSFIDPAIATDGKTVYLVADLFPAGIALNTSVSSPATGSTGFTEDGDLLLRVNGHETIDGNYGATVAQSDYDYYLDLETLTIHEVSDDSKVDGYTVDAYFNITDAEGTTTNLFCADAPFQVYPTDYLYMTSSEDGLNWSEPTLINLKEPEEQVLLVGPGNGIVLDDGTLVFSVYEFTSGKSSSGQEAGIIWRDDAGEWHRSASVADCGVHWTSEATAVQIDSTTIRQFVRDGHTTLFYLDYTLQDGIWVPGELVDTGMVKRGANGNQLSAIKYSEKIDGKDAILISLATSTSARKDGKIYVGLVNDDKTMEWKYSYSVTEPNGDFAYSCLTELSDGSIALLYESTNSREIFTVIPIDDVISNKTNLNYTQKSITMMEDGIETVIEPSGDYSQTADTSMVDTNVATVALESAVASGSTARPGSAEGQYNGTAVDLSSCLFTFAKDANADTYTISADANGSTVYLDPSEGTAGFPVKSNLTNKMTVEATAPGADTVYLRNTGGTNKQAYLFFYRDTLKFDRVNDLQNNQTWMKACSVLLYAPVSGDQASSTEIPGYVKVTDFSDLDGNEYLIVFRADNDNYYVLYPSTSTTHKSAQAAQVVPGDASTKMTVTAVAPGNTGILLGTTYYDIVVNAYEHVAVELAPHREWREFSVEGTPEVGEYDEDVATVAVTTDDAAVNLGQEADVSSAEYTFAVEGDTVTATATVGDTTVYLSPAGQGAGYPFSTSAASFTLSAGSIEDSFYLRDSSHYLYFDGTDFDRVGSVDATRCSFYLYVADPDAANSDIAGYRQVTSMTEVENGQYLVVPASVDDIILLYPSTSTTDKMAHVATYTATTTLKITPGNEGETSVKVGETIFDITVAEPEKYSSENPFLFPIEDETTTLEFELGTIDNDESNDGAGPWPAEVWYDSNNNTTFVNSVNLNDTVSVPFTAKYAGEYEVTLYYESGSSNNKLAWSDEGEIVAEGSKQVENSDTNATTVYSMSFTMTVNQPGSSTLVFGAADAGNAPRLDKLEATFAGLVPTVDGKNVALGRPAVSNGDEAKTTPVSNLTDGNTTSRDSRWASTVGDKPVWAYIDLANTYNVKTVKLFWEARKATNYEIQVAAAGADLDTDEAWKTVYEGDQPDEKTETILLEGDDITARYVRILVKDYVAQDPDSSGTWNNVSLYEVEVYGNALVSYDALSEAIATAKDKSTEGMTAESVEAFETALQAAKDLVEGRDASQERIDEAEEALEAAIAGLTEIETHTVTFVVPEGVTVPDAQTVTDGNQATKPADPTRTGYTFDGWFADDAEDAYDFDTTVTSDLTLTAHWTLNAPTVTVSASPENPTEGKTVTLTAKVTHDLTGLDYTYSWQKNGTDVADADESTLEVTESGTYTVTVTASDAEGGTSSATSEGVKVSFAEQTVSYTVTFDADGGTPAPAQQTVESGSTVAKPATDPARTGYNFLGWYTKSSQGTPKRYDFTTPVTSDLALVAGWEFKAPNAELSVSPENPVEGDTVTITVTATHDLGDGVNYTYYWTHNGELIYGEYDSTLEVTEPGRYGVFVNATDKSNPNAHYMTGESIEVTFAPKPVDFSALAAAIADGTAINTEGKTQDSADALRDALVVGEALLENPEATQEQVDDAAQAIRDAIANLEDEPDQGGQPGTGEEPGTGEQPGDDQQGGSQQPGGNQKPGDTTKPGTGGSTVGGASEPSGDGLAQTGDPATMAAALATALTGVAAVAAATKARRMK